MINLYKEISEEILRILDTNDIDDVKVVQELKKRQELIDNLSGEELADFRKVYKDKEVHKLDKSIKSKLGQEMIAVKKEISEFKINKTANSAYANMNKNNLNIFYKKV